MGMQISMGDGASRCQLEMWWGFDSNNKGQPQGQGHTHACTIKDDHALDWLSRVATWGSAPVCNLLATDLESPDLSKTELLVKWGK